MRPRVMGILNLTPDSFSDGGRIESLEAALQRAHELVAQGADVLDVGGESTRPRAEAVDEILEIARVVPVIRAIQDELDIPISIDTMKPAVAEAAVAAGAWMWNDITALGFAPDSLATAARLGCEVVLMHMQGEPATMQDDPRYDDVVEEVASFLSERAQRAIASGVPREKIWLDPGIGFGKRLEHNLALLANLDRFARLDFPLLVGASRKGFIRTLDRGATDPGDRLGGSIAVALTAAQAGAAMVRVHDVRETAQALIVEEAIREGRADG
ncbi:MAG TPA: dihydropteroate synthase [Caulobacteraceae bacterium]